VAHVHYSKAVGFFSIDRAAFQCAAAGNLQAPYCPRWLRLQRIAAQNVAMIR
jgi:hypothetical protein